MVVLHDALRDGEAQARAVGPAGKERLEDARLDGNGDAGAGVGEVHVHNARAGAIFLGAMHGEFAALRHGREGIEREVEHDLLQLSLVALHHHRTGGGGVV